MSDIPNQPPTPAPLPPPEPRWPSAVALLAIGGLQMVLPAHLVVGPEWLLIVLVAMLAIPGIAFYHSGLYRWSRAIGYVLSTLVTLAVISSLTLLVAGIPAHRDSPKDLLLAASGLWFSNLLVFATWYWRLDAGGPHERHQRGAHHHGSFLFPQMTMTAQARAAAGCQHWQPGFVDYLFLAFNTSTAFSPTDVPVLSRWAKIMMMLQAVISLGTVAILAARAVNVL